MKLFTKAMSIPWGEADCEEAVAPGVYWVGTAGHGGILVEKSRARELLSERAIKIGRSWGLYLAYEEDCDAYAVYYEHPEYCTWMKAEEMKKLAEENLHRWNPAYFNPR